MLLKSLYRAAAARLLQEAARKGERLSLFLLKPGTFIANIIIEMLLFYVIEREKRWSIDEKKVTSDQMS